MKNITVGLRMSAVKELSACWIVFACVHISSHPEIITNGFKKSRHLVGTRCLGGLNVYNKLYRNNRMK